MMLPKQKRIRSEKHRRWIASLSCAVSGKFDCQAAHIRHGFYGLGVKPSDSLCLPLNWQEHQRQHSEGEPMFYEPFGGVGKAKELAQLLWQISGNTEEAEYLLSRFRQGVL